MTGWGALIRDAREAAGLNKAELADRIGMSPSMVSRMEADKVFIEPDVFRRLCGALRSLSQVELVNALGYEVTVIGADRLPRRVRRSGVDLGDVATLMGHSTLTQTRHYSQEGEEEAAIASYRQNVG